ncbi:MAG: ASKHA domain-containing protein [Thermodesulfobacteriota bacterium]
MPKLTVYPIGEVIEMRRGETVRDALYRAGVELDTPCNGQGICGKCRIRVENPESVEKTPHPDISAEEETEGIRLACQLTPRKDITIHLLAPYQRNEYRILEGQRYPGDRQEEEGHRNVAEDAGISSKTFHPAARIVESDGGFWLDYDRRDPRQLSSWVAGQPPKGLAIDIGTTTLVVTLLSLDTCQELSTASSLNPQSNYGHDVVRRIQAGSTPEGLAELSNCVRNGLNELIKEVCEDTRTLCNEIVDVVIGGNTTMLQLAAGIDPEPLGRTPFTVGIESGRTYPAEQFGLAVNASARVYIPPVVHAYIGADISAGLLVCQGFFEPDQSVLFVDVGTNGEMGLNADGRCLMTSTAAGPAFEGMGISSGTRAQIGALERVYTNGREIIFKSIGNAPIKGICGSGIIDITAALFKLGVIDSSGRMRRPKETEGLEPDIAARLCEINEKAAFHIAGEVYFTQEDVRQVQLAKSAIRAAIDILMEEAAIEPDTLERVVIAGGFGYSLRPESLGTIGLLPSAIAPKVYFAGNTCRIGCVRLLRNVSNRRFLESHMKGVEHVTIETRPDFMDRYVSSMEFPESEIKNPTP